MKRGRTHSAKKILKVRTPKTSPGHPLSPCRISGKSINYKDFYRHFKIFFGAGTNDFEVRLELLR
jgi:hypothetical protein